MNIPESSTASTSTPRREGSNFRLAYAGERCRAHAGYRHPACGRDAVMAMLRSTATRTGRRGTWWAYCELHSYGRVVRDGEVWWDPAAAEELRRDPAADRA